MTEANRAILQADQRRHLALAASCKETCLKEHHMAIAEALAAAVEECEVKECRSEIKCVSCQMVSVPSLPRKRCRAGRIRRRAK